MDVHFYVLNLSFRYRKKQDSIPLFNHETLSKEGMFSLTKLEFRMIYERTFDVIQDDKVDSVLCFFNR